MKEMVTISKLEYEALLEDKMWLEALEQSGVDNWKGFSYAHELMDEWQKEDELNRNPPVRPEDIR